MPVELRFPSESCDPCELTLRASSLELVDHDYVPADHDGTRTDMFGYFTNDRHRYDRRCGVVDDRWHRFASRCNLWEQPHASRVVACNTAETTPVGKSPHRDEDGDGTEDERASVGPSPRCDEFRGADCEAELKWPARWSDDYVPPAHEGWSSCFGHDVGATGELGGRVSRPNSPTVQGMSFFR